MKVLTLLADAAQADAGGKVGALGLGWTFIPTPAPAYALVIFLDIGPDDTSSDEYGVRCELLKDTGEPAMLEDHDGPRPLLVEFAGKINLHPPVGGKRFRTPVVLNMLPGMTLAPGSYRWKVEVVGYEGAVAYEDFDVIGPTPDSDPPEPTNPAS